MAGNGSEADVSVWSANGQIRHLSSVLGWRASNGLEGWITDIYGGPFACVVIRRARDSNTIDQTVWSPTNGSAPPFPRRSLIHQLSSRL